MPPKKNKGITKRGWEGFELVFDRNIFPHEENARRHHIISKWTFVEERRVELVSTEYPEFTEEINRRRWGGLANIYQCYDPEVVRLFYANAWPLEEGQNARKAKVRGRWVHYDCNTINQYLGSPGRRDDLCRYSEIRGRGVINVDEVAERLCKPGCTYDTNHVGKAVKILRNKMNTLTQVWMSFLLANVIPTKHSSDIPMSKAELIYSITNRWYVDIAPIISDEIHQFVTQDVPRSPNSSKTLGFPWLITELCLKSGVGVNHTARIRPPINIKFIEKYCGGIEQEEQAQEKQPQEVPALTDSVSPPSWQEEMRLMRMHMEHIELQQSSNHLSMMHIHQGLYSQVTLGVPNPWMPPADFEAYVAWPGDRPISHGGGGTSQGATQGARPSSATFGGGDMGAYQGMDEEYDTQLV